MEIVFDCSQRGSLKHIFGVHNPIADAISRFQVARFRQLTPHADLHRYQRQHGMTTGCPRHSATKRSSDDIHVKFCCSLYIATVFIAFKTICRFLTVKEFNRVSIAPAEFSAICCSFGQVVIAFRYTRTFDSHKVHVCCSWV